MNRVCHWRLLLVSLALWTGCAESGRDRLIGTWYGRPQTAAERNARLIAGDVPPAAVLPLPPSGEEGAPSGAAEESPTELIWAQFDFGIRLRFARDGQVEMSLEDGSQPIVGKWWVVDEAGERMMIEMEVSLPPAGDEQGKSDARRVDRRRFGVLWHNDDTQGRGFSLDHDNANPRLGSLYFRPAEG